MYIFKNILDEKFREIAQLCGNEFTAGQKILKIPGQKTLEIKYINQFHEFFF